MFERSVQTSEAILIAAVALLVLYEIVRWATSPAGRRMQLWSPWRAAKIGAGIGGAVVVVTGVAFPELIRYASSDPNSVYLARFLNGALWGGGLFAIAAYVRNRMVGGNARNNPE